MGLCNFRFCMYFAFIVCGVHFNDAAVNGRDQSVLIGNESCGKGPVYWCDSLRNAIQCSAVAHCTQTVWETLAYVPNAEKCSTCVNSLYNVRSAINSGSQKYVVLELLRDMCDVASKKSKSPNMECHLATRFIMFNGYNHFKKLFSNQKISNDVLCSINGFCLEDISAGPEVHCTDLQKACADFTTAAECNTVSQCMEGNWKNMEHLETTDIVGECSLCTNLVKEFRSYVETNKSSVETRKLIENICTLPLVSDDYQKCISWIDKNIDQLIRILDSNYTPTAVCTLLGFCVLGHNDKVVVRVNNVELIVPDFIFNDVEDVINTESIATSTKVNLLGADDCTWGPSYWCINITTSAKCRATTHCIQSVWSTQKFEEDNDDVCKICKDMVQQARDTLQSNETQSELREVLEGSCKLIHIKPVVNNCIKLMDDFIPQLTEMLLSMLNPTAVCSVAGLCNSPEIDIMLQLENTKPVEYKNHKLCKHCNKFISYLKKKFNRSTKLDVHREFIQVCGEMSTYSDVCTSSVTNNFDTIYDRLIRDLEPYKVCHLTGMCAYKYHFHPDTNKFENDDGLDNDIDEFDTKSEIPCDLCKQLAEHLREELVSNTTEEEFHQILVGICKQTGKFQVECLNFVNANFDLVYNYLVKEFNATELCKDVGLCKRSANFITDTADGINGRLVLLPNFIGAFNVTELNTNIGTEITESSTKSPTCTLCEYILHYIEQILTNPQEQSEIEKAVEKVCQYVPKSLTKQCDEFIQNYGPLIISLLAEEIDPSLVCPELKICPSRKTPLSPAKIDHYKPSCSVCLLLFDAIFTELQENKTEESIERTLINVCTRLPRLAIDNCKSLVKSYYTDVIDMITADFTPEEACVFLHLCSSSDEQLINHNVIRTASIESDELIEFNEIPTLSMDELGELNDNVLQTTRYGKQCILCQALLKNLEIELTLNATEVKIEKMLDKFCDHLHGTLRKQCQSFVEKNSERMIELMLSQVNVTEICAVLKFCQYPKELNEVRSRCQFCEAVIGSLNGILADPYLDYEIVEYVDKVCDIFPKKQGPVCNEIMSQVIPTLESIAHQIPPWFICTKIKFCPYNVNSPLISNTAGGSPCTWGPAYWCQSKTTAAMCQTTEHCQMYFWKGTTPPEK